MLKSKTGVKEHEFSSSMDNEKKGKYKDWLYRKRTKIDVECRKTLATHD